MKNTELHKKLEKIIRASIQLDKELTGTRLKTWNSEFSRKITSLEQFVRLHYEWEDNRDFSNL